MEFPSCVNCLADFQDADQKHFNLHIVLPVDLVSSAATHSSLNSQQVFQAVEIPVIDTLKEIYNLRSLDDPQEKPILASIRSEISGLNTNNTNSDNDSTNTYDGKDKKDPLSMSPCLQVPVCNNCANMLANLYLAHKTFGQHRNPGSFLSKHIEQSKKRKILIVKVSNPNFNNVSSKASTSTSISNEHGSSKEVMLTSDNNLNQETVTSPVPLITMSLDDENINEVEIGQNDSPLPEAETEGDAEDGEDNPNIEKIVIHRAASASNAIPLPATSKVPSLVMTSTSESSAPFTDNTFGDEDFNSDDLLCEVKVEEFEQDYASEIGEDFHAASSSAFLEEHTQDHQQPQLSIPMQSIIPTTRVFTVASTGNSSSSLPLRNEKNIIGSQKRIEQTSTAGNICFAQPLLLASINPASLPNTIPIPIPSDTSFGISSLTGTTGVGAMRPATQTIINGPTCQPRINLLNLPLDQLSHPTNPNGLILDDSILNNMTNMSCKLKQIPLCRPGATLEVSDPTRRVYIVPKGGSPFQCPNCPQMFMLPVVYRNHILAHIKKQEENGLSCKLCPAFRFETLNDLISHHKYNHDEPATTTGETNNVLRCEHPDCYYIATSTADSLHHSVYKHSQASIKAHVPRTRKEENDLIRLHLLRASMEVDVIEEKFPLKQDDKPDIFPTTTQTAAASNFLKTFSIVFPDLTCHITISDGPPYRCPFCSKPFNCNVNWQSLKKHITEIHLSFLSGRTYTCKRCSKTFERSSTLRNHHRRCGKPDTKKIRPIQPKIFKCERCPRKFSSEKNKQVHLSHCGKQCFECQVCGLVFTRNCKLVSHMYKHATSRPFICDQCGRSYKNKHGLSFHQKISHTEEGRLKYNELMRNKNRQRKLRKSGLATIICKEEGEEEHENNNEDIEMDIHEEGEDEEEEGEEEGHDEEEEEASEEDEEENIETELQDHIIGY